MHLNFVFIWIINIVQNPTEEKYQTIRINNKVYQERVIPLEGVVQFLRAAYAKSSALMVNIWTNCFTVDF